MNLKKNYPLILFFAITIALFPSVRKGLFSHIPQFFVDLLRGRHHGAETFLVGSGRFVLPETVRLWHQQLAALRAPHFSLSEEVLKGDPELKQRAIEGLWPLRYLEQSHFILKLTPRPHVETHR